METRRTSHLPSAVLVAGVALAASVLVARAPWPPGIFTKYLLLADAREAGERVADISPLYALLVSALGDHARQGALVIHCLLHALTAVAISAIVARMVGARWGLLAGLAAALYPPFLVHAGVHEPETLLQALLASGLLAGQAARDASDSPRRALLLAGLAGLLCGAAALARPHHALLAPAWALWIASSGGRLRERARLAAVLLMAAGAPVGAFAIASASEGRATVVMNPGPVFYEGNGPAATGLTRCAPLAVQWIEREHPESVDHAHVAYRAIAAAAGATPGDGGGANRWWFDRALDGARAQPAAFCRRLLVKAMHALSPREFHDLRITEDLQRRVTAVLPWGFGILSLGLVWLPLARRARWMSLLGPLSVAGLAWLMQVAFYCSARQRLGLATALLIITPVLAADLARRHLTLTVRPAVALGAACVLAVAVTFAGGRAAWLDATGWDATGVARARGPGAALAACFDGRALRPAGERAELAGLLDGIEAFRARGDLPPDFARLAGRGLDATSDDRTVAVPEFWLALASSGDERARWAERALAVRPHDPLVEALVRSSGRWPDGAAWPSPGVDPVTAACALAMVTRDPGPVGPWRDRIPELASAIPSP